MEKFSIYPAIDLRQGQVVRLQEGDPARQKTYSADPAEAAKRWIGYGTRWLHVVNLDGAFGEADSANLRALESILAVALAQQVSVQFGGGIRSLEAVRRVLALGVQRAVLGTAAIEQPELLAAALAQFGAECLAVSIDARDGMAQTRGWKNASTVRAMDLARKLSSEGLEWLVFTDISRDGMQTGINLQATEELSRETGLNVIASGGVRDMDDVRGAYRAGLPGIIIGKALYEGAFDVEKLFKFPIED
jgi:phosphoribosylformimino-5-aminoimidazole carboxamide ribotide isomerase